MVAGCVETFEGQLTHGGFIRLAASGLVRLRTVTAGRLDVVEQVQAVRLQGDQAGQFQLETGKGLPGAAVAEVDTHRAKIKRARRVDQRLDGCRVAVIGLGIFEHAHRARQCKRG